MKSSRSGQMLETLRVLVFCAPFEIIPSVKSPLSAAFCQAARRTMRPYSIETTANDSI